MSRANLCVKLSSFQQKNILQKLFEKFGSFELGRLEQTCMEKPTYLPLLAGPLF